MNEQFDNRYTLIDSADQQNFYPNTLATRTQVTLTDAAAATTLPSGTGFVQTALQTLRNSVKAALSYFSGGKLNLANITSSSTANRILRTGTANAAPTWAQVALTTDVSGALPVANGGTAATTAVTALTNLGAASSANLTAHTGNVTNPHSVTKEQVGLGSVDNIADSAKSVSKAATLTTARTIAISGKATGTATSFNGSANISIPITSLSQTAADYPISGIKTALSLVKGDVGLGSVDNTADSAKSVSSATTLTAARTIAVSGKATGTAISFNGSANITIPITALSQVAADYPVALIKTAMALVKADVGLSNVDNTGDSAKNVLSASKLTTTRQINGVAFDGTQNITVTIPDATQSVAGKMTANDKIRLDTLVSESFVVDETVLSAGPNIEITLDEVTGKIRISYNGLENPVDITSLLTGGNPYTAEYGVKEAGQQFLRSLTPNSLGQLTVGLKQSSQFNFVGHQDCLPTGKAVLDYSYFDTFEPASFTSNSDTTTRKTVATTVTSRSMENSVATVATDRAARSGIVSVAVDWANVEAIAPATTFITSMAVKDGLVFVHYDNAPKSKVFDGTSWSDIEGYNTFFIFSFVWKSDLYLGRCNNAAPYIQLYKVNTANKSVGSPININYIGPTPYHYGTGGGAYGLLQKRTYVYKNKVFLFTTFNDTAASGGYTYDMFQVIDLDNLTVDSPFYDWNSTLSTMRQQPWIIPERGSIIFGHGQFEVDMETLVAIPVLSAAATNFSTSGFLCPPTFSNGSIVTGVRVNNGQHVYCGQVNLDAKTVVTATVNWGYGATSGGYLQLEHNKYMTMEYYNSNLYLSILNVTGPNTYTNTLYTASGLPFAMLGNAYCKFLKYSNGYLYAGFGIAGAANQQMIKVPVTFYDSDSNELTIPESVSSLDFS